MAASGVDFMFSRFSSFLGHTVSRCILMTIHLVTTYRGLKTASDSPSSDQDQEHGDVLRIRLRVENLSIDDSLLSDNEGTNLYFKIISGSGFINLLSALL